MKKGDIFWLKTGGVFVVVGLVIFAAVMTVYRWDFGRLGTVSYETETYEISEAFHSIVIDTETADIAFSQSEDGCSRVVCLEQEMLHFNVAVQDGALKISETDERDWQDHVGIGLRSPQVTLYLPKARYDALSITESTGDIDVPDFISFGSAVISLSTGSVSFSAAASGTVRIETSTGDIRIDRASAETFDLSTSTGSVEVSAAPCHDFTSVGSTGDIILKNVIAEEKVSIRRTTGNVIFDGADAGEIYVQTDTGDVSGRLESGKKFTAKTSTGQIDVPEDSTVGICEVVTSTGDIQLTVNK